MKDRKKIYISISIAAIALLLLWIFLYWNKATIEEEKVVSHPKDQSETIVIPDTISTITPQDTVHSIKREVATMSKLPVKVSKSLSKKETVQQVETSIPNRIFPPLQITGLPRSNTQEMLTKLQPIEVSHKNTEFDWKADTLPVKKGIDILRIKKVGRFDRGIVNYRFMPKGQTLVGMDFSFWQFGSENSKLLFAYLDNFNFDARTLSINPFLGYFYKDNQAIGIKWGYKKISGSLGNATVKIDEDVNFTLKDLGLREEIYGCTLFHRSYIGLDAGKRFGLFNETSLNVGYGRSVFTRGSDETLKETSTKIIEARLGISPGLAVFIMDNVSVECSIGVMGLKYRQEKQSNNLGETGQRHNSGANFKINLFDLNLGLIISL